MDNQMNLSDIEYEIDLLENEEFTAENVADLASLYIVYDNMKHDLNRTSDGIEKELNDILPSYQNYCESKKRYQLGNANEGEVIKTLNLLCKEISEFILSLYSGTDMNKERIYIRNEITKIYEKLTK
jgi:hypothetical protein